MIGIFMYVYHWARCIENELKNDMFHAIVIKLFGSGELQQQRLPHLHELRMYVTMTVRRNRKYLPQAV
jgi:hypothetical protein